MEETTKSQIIDKIREEACDTQADWRYGDLSHAVAVGLLRAVQIILDADDEKE